MKYQEALDFLYRQLPMFSRVGAAAYKPGLDTSLRLDEYFGHPHHSFKSIHVGGTNGKGSTSHSLASVLQAHGYKVGLYTSPHLVDFRERMRVNGNMIPEQDVVEFVEKWQSCGYDGHPSFFELTMMMAFCWFKKMNVDYAVIEVGMGGRLDSTNIITPIGCVITNISPDHMQFLGDTPEKIAGEKAGIIKKGIPVVIGEAEGAVKKIFTDRAKETGAPIVFAEENPELVSAVELTDLDGWHCTARNGLVFDVHLAGDYQKKNINTVLAAIDMLRTSGVEISDSDIRDGMGDIAGATGFMGRWSVISQYPLAIADTGHNEAGITYNMGQLNRILSRRRNGGKKVSKLRMVMGFVSDKDIDHILSMLPKDAEYYITNAMIPRAMPAGELAVHFDSAGIPSRQYEDVGKAYEAALHDSIPDDIIYIGGSTFIVADYLSYRKQKEQQ